ncbi:hypothetical protein KR222_010194, partial [Zaprionus bogoriensis]
MDSRMLNVFHEDPFEGNFVKFDPDSNFWSPTDDEYVFEARKIKNVKLTPFFLYSLQLTDTLNGILPIAPTDEPLLSQKEAEEQLQNSKNLLIYSDFVDQQLSDDAQVLNGQIYRAITDIEVEACEQQLQLRGLIASDDDDDDTGGRLVEDDDDDRQSQCSNSTFRTRTDSSSIGDYESHSSDYDDDIEEVTAVHKDEAVAGILTMDALALQEDRKCRTLSTNTIGSDADAFGLNIDVNNFDLADFITKDDFTENLNSLREKETLPVVTMKEPAAAAPTCTSRKVIRSIKDDGPAQAASLPKPVIISSKSRDSDYDSDSIIDVETVDVIDVDESLWAAGLVDEPATATDDLCYVDNVKADPSWCPKQTKRIVSAEVMAKPAQASAPTSAAATAVNAVKPKASNNICLVPNKKQCDFLKRKVGVKTPNAVAVHKSKVTAKKMQEASKSMAAGKQQTVAKMPESQPISTGLGLGGKNLALLKHERDAAAATPSSAVATPAPKRKLNLEEYKQRRCGAIIPSKSQANGLPAATPSTGPTPVKQAKLEASKSVPPTPVPRAQPSPHKAAISNIVNGLKCPASSQTAVATDPITVAKNKVLRMLEMKRAQQLKIIDSRVSAKVPRVTKLPPLKDIVKDTYCMETEPEPEPAAVPVTGQGVANSKLQADYEEIIIVSASCNTDITIPPHQASVALRDNKTTPSSRSLLKSSVLLYNISNGSEAGKDITNSLIASIQSEVVRQTNCVALAANTAAETTTKPSADKNAQHGEDMVIMHLAKNRVRKRMVSMGTQTDLQPEFPLLTLPTTHQSRERTRRSYRKRRVNGSVSNGSSCSSSSSSSTCSSIASYRSRSNSNSMERLRHSDATAACSSSIGCGGYSSRSTRRHRSSVSSSSYSESGKYERQQRQRQRRTSYNKRRSKNANRGNLSTSGSEYSDRERSRSPRRRSRSRSNSASRFGNGNKNNNSNNNRRGYVDRNVSQPAVEERRIVYVGRIEQETTKEMLRRKFLRYGSIKNITIHYKENGMKYGFVTFECAQDAFTAIDSSPRDEQINMYDISFGGRRAFCRASYADLDNAGINNLQSYVYPKAALPAPAQEDSFEALLLKVKAKLNAGKPAAAAPTPAPASNEAVTPAAVAP